MPTFRKRLTTRIDLARSGKRRQNWLAPLILGLVIGVSACALLVWFLQQDSIGELQPYLIGGAVTFLAILIFRAIFLGSSGKLSRKRATGEDESHSTVNLFVALLTGVASFLGMLLLMRQNELMKQQNVINQQQTALSEAARRSSYVMLMDNILNQVNEELRQEGVDTTPYHATRRLSTVTIGRIAALSQSLRPIRYLVEGDTLSRYLSPERGQLLLALVYARLDTMHTYPEIYAKSDFSYADLEGAKLESAFLQKASLQFANLVMANLVKADLREADLKGANLIETYLEGADLERADLRKAELRYAKLYEANLTSASLYEANLESASLIGVNLENADLICASLIKVDFTGANLWLTDLRKANLRGTSFRGAKLEQAIVDTLSFIGDLKYLKVEDWKMLAEEYVVDTTERKDKTGKLYLILPKNK